MQPRYSSTALLPIGQLGKIIYNDGWTEEQRLYLCDITMVNLLNNLIT